ncbi:hypothetical protein [Spirosoma linguale]|uniref:Uncharacterized protein n=1 Tax=Spirosoma linguale (strain ATCC 33905 / DSM 74 / LMG 10896 / Claus 1) TaxID=504472 RepID=D2QG31_SPILD|nr:hypothetical protein Slin_0574 [Spirosoma linguale DSM 74]
MPLAAGLKTSTTDVIVGHSLWLWPGVIRSLTGVNDQADPLAKSIMQCISRPDSTDTEKPDDHRPAFLYLCF